MFAPGHDGHAKLLIFPAIFPATWSWAFHFLGAHDPAEKRRTERTPEAEDFADVPDAGCDEAVRAIRPEFPEREDHFVSPSAGGVVARARMRAASFLPSHQE